jgi:hypothetical protein
MDCKTAIIYMQFIREKKTEGNQETTEKFRFYRYMAKYFGGILAGRLRD